MVSDMEAVRSHDPILVHAAGDDFPWATLWGVLGMPEGFGLPGTAWMPPVFRSQVQEWRASARVWCGHLGVLVVANRASAPIDVGPQLTDLDIFVDGTSRLPVLLPGHRVGESTFEGGVCHWMTLERFERLESARGAAARPPSLLLLHTAFSYLLEVAAGSRAPFPGWEHLADRLLGEFLGHPDTTLSQQSIRLLALRQAHSGVTP
jgi:hypothetical protein